MSARGELPEVDEHPLEELLDECSVMLRRLMLAGTACLALALVLGTLYLQATAARAL